MSDDDLNIIPIVVILVGIGVLIGFVMCGIIVNTFVGFSPEQVATQICEYLDTELIDYKVSGREFEYIKCGEQELIEGINVDKLINIIGD